MNSDDYIHAIKILKDKKKEFENEINFVNDEINIVNKDYINRNSKFKIDDKVKFQKNIYTIKRIHIAPSSNFFVYNLCPVCLDLYSLYSIYEHNLELIERNNND